MKIFNDIRFYIVITSLSLIWGVNQNISKDSEITPLKEEIIKLNQNVEKLESEKDSINMELFSTRVDLGRHEIAYEIFMERNPKAAEQYGTIISQETE